MQMRYTACCRSEIVLEPHTETILRGEHKGETFQSRHPSCATCRETWPKIAYVTTRKTRSGDKSECGGACLNGKTSCDCKCNGRCHGAGKCQCGEVAS